MLPRAGRIPEPAVIGEIEKPARAAARRQDFAREDRLVADQRGEGRRPVGGKGATNWTRGKTARQRHELAEAPALKRCGMGQVLAERDEMHLVIGVDDGAVAVDDIDAVEE